VNTNGYYDFSVPGSLFGADGAKAITARVMDAAGNVGAPSGTALSLTQDSAAPTIASVSSTGTGPYDLTIVFSETTSGVTQIVYTGATNSSSSSTTTIAANTSGTLTDSGVNVTPAGNPFSFVLIDAAGNSSTSYNATFDTSSYKSVSVAGRSSAGKPATASRRTPSAIGGPVPTPIFLTSLVEVAKADSRADAGSADDSSFAIHPVEVRFTPSTGMRAKAIDTARLSLLRRPAMVASSAEGKSPARAPAIPARFGQSTPSDANAERGAAPSIPAPKPSQNGEKPSLPARVPAPGIDMYAAQSKNRREGSVDCEADQE
jgi:hypothetical protein